MASPSRASGGSGPHVAIVDYGMCNLFSVELACRAAGMQPRVTSNPEDLLAADRMILPGVGAFAQAMATLRQTGLDEAVRAVAAAGKPMLGICLGMQLFFDESEEFGRSEGLGLIPGKVQRFRFPPQEGRPPKTPQVGWNTLRPPQGQSNFASAPLAAAGPGAYMYFCHSFMAVPAHADAVAAVTEYGGVEYCSAAAWKNLLALQFHPEKSGPPGQAILQAWAGMGDDQMT